MSAKRSKSKSKKGRLREEDDDFPNPYETGIPIYAASPFSSQSVEAAVVAPPEAKPPSSSKPTSGFRDIVTSYLLEDTRILASVLNVQRVFESPLYSVYICIYSGLADNPRLYDDLITVIVLFKKEKLRIMFKLWTDDITGDRAEYTQSVLDRLEKEKKGPYHLVRDSKTWTHIPFTEEDQKELLKANIQVELGPN